LFFCITLAFDRLTNQPGLLPEPLPK
jgi:hypothetical protein